MSVHNVAAEIRAAALNDEDFDFSDVGIKTDVIAESTAATGVTIDGVLLKDSQVTTDAILEKTSGAGVTVDGVILKDGNVTSLSSAGFTTGTNGNFTSGAAGDFVVGALGHIYPDDGTGTASSNAVTISKGAGVITTEALGTAGLAEQVITLTNTQIAAADIVLASLGTVSGTGGTPVLGVVTAAAGSCTFTIHNLHATEAFTSRVFKINFIVFKA